MKIELIDASKITDYKRNQFELEYFLLFAILVAGKTAKVISKSLLNLLKETHEINKLNEFLPFKSLINFSEDEIKNLLKKHGIGCYSLKSKAIYNLIRQNFDLKNVTIKELENIFGIGLKTSRFFMLHSRENCNLAVLDTHILKYLKKQGFVVPKSTPNKIQYYKLEQIFLNLVKNSGISNAEFDLMIWNQYSR